MITFQVLDLVSQAITIEEKLEGKSNIEIINWLQQKGKLHRLKKRSTQEKQLFRFNSNIGFEATFWLDNGKFFFIGDHSTFRPHKIL